MTKFFDPDQPIALDVPEGRLALVVTLYSDAEAKIRIGSGCEEDVFHNGARSCLHLQLHSLWNGCEECAPDAGSLMCCDHRCVDPAGDLDNCGGCGVRCGLLHTIPSCVSGKCSSECEAGWADCDGAPGCESNLAEAGLKLCRGACVAAASCCTADDCGFPPGPPRCFAPSCSGPGGECTYPLIPGASVCGSTCCVPDHALCNSDCVLTCASGFADCDGDVASGCECEGSTCCSGGCAVKHSNGVGQNWWDCVATGTFDLQQATAACVAFTSDLSQCHTNACGAVCSDGSPNACNCWIYSGSAKGRVKSSSAGNCSCNGNSGSWN